MSQGMAETVAHMASFKPLEWGRKAPATSTGESCTYIAKDTFERSPFVSGCALMEFALRFRIAVPKGKPGSKPENISTEVLINSHA